MSENKFYFVKCKNCKKEVKIPPQVYRSKQKQICDSCLTKTFKKFKKKLNTFNSGESSPYFWYPKFDLSYSVAR